MYGNDFAPPEDAPGGGLLGEVEAAEAALREAAARAPRGGAAPAALFVAPASSGWLCSCTVDRLGVSPPAGHPSPPRGTYLEG